MPLWAVGVRAGICIGIRGVRGSENLHCWAGVAQPHLARKRIASASTVIMTGPRLLLAAPAVTPAWQASPVLVPP